MNLKCPACGNSWPYTRLGMLVTNSDLKPSWQATERCTKCETLLYLRPLIETAIREKAQCETA